MCCPLLYDWCHPSVAMNCKVIEGEASKSGPIVIVHGMLGSSTNWMSLARIMQKRTRRAVLIPDLRNHGLSPHHESHTYFDMASDIRRLCADRGLSDVTLVAHSMGARAAMLLCLLGTILLDVLKLLSLIGTR